MTRADDTCGRQGARATHTAALTLIMLAAILGPHPVLASDRSFCLEGQGIRAIEACRRALRNERDTLALYRALGGHLEASGNLDGAIATYREGLAAHPGDSQLTARLKISQSNRRERAWIEQRNQAQPSGGSAEARAQFTVNKIRCTTRTGDDALRACEQALSVSPDDRELQQRLAQLQASQPVAPRITEQAQPPAPPPPETVPSAEQSRQRALVARIQQELTDLGYTPGVADGIAGGRTVSAVSAFARARGLAQPTPALDGALADELQRALDEQADALERLQQATRLLTDGRFSDARRLAQSTAQAAAWSPAVSRQSDALLARTADAEQAWQQQRVRQLAAEVDAHLRDGDIASAKSLVDEALASFPDAEPLQRVRDALAAAVIERARNEAAAQRQRAGDEKQASAQRAFAAGDFEQATAIINDGLALAPGHAGLLALASQVDAAQRDAERLADERAAAARRVEQEQERAAAAEREQADAARRQVQVWLADAETALAQDDFAAARQKLALARGQAPNDPRLQVLQKHLQTGERSVAIREKLQAAAAAADGPDGAENALAMLDEAASLTNDALALDPDAKVLWQLRSDVSARRQSLVAEQQRQRKQGEEIAQITTAARGLMQQMSRLETEAAAREIALKLDAQKILEQVWSSGR